MPSPSSTPAAGHGVGVATPAVISIPHPDPSAASPPTEVDESGVVVQGGDVVHGGGGGDRRRNRSSPRRMGAPSASPPATKWRMGRRSDAQSDRLGGDIADVIPLRWVDDASSFNGYLFSPRSSDDEGGGGDAGGDDEVGDDDGGGGDDGGDDEGGEDRELFGSVMDRRAQPDGREDEDDFMEYGHRARRRRLMRGRGGAGLGPRGDGLRHRQGLHVVRRAGPPAPHMDAADMRAAWPHPAFLVETGVQFVEREDRMDEFMQTLVGDDRLPAASNRFARYREFAALCGYGRRQRLPAEFEEAMRMRWPNPSDDGYVGFIPDPSAPPENDDPRPG
ncbi:hypothetical protein CBR_g34552 [Chara braunii]|uniref:Uncharacterized protein n=1 Tax=Chara braunii TaxID=69332 RepID=A0A388LIX9_CHABU|nr:hypothetical protein CBR_g34552 [Chara braunii]|eukprot:GBG82268.1 hypothetical protein CBR_g34552 [Chara braunii]